MHHLLIKLIIYPLSIFLCSALLPNVSFANVSQTLLVGWTLAIVAYLADVALIDSYGNTMQTSLDFVITTLILIIYQYILPSATITLMGSIITALVFAAAEYITHRWLLRRNKYHSNA